MGFYLVKVGSDMKPATNEDIENVEKGLEEAKQNKDKIFVTGCDISVEYVPLIEDGVSIIKVGSDNRPATKEQIAEVTSTIKDLQNSKDEANFLVTHHCISTQYIPKN